MSKYNVRPFVIRLHPPTYIEYVARPDEGEEPFGWAVYQEIDGLEFWVEDFETEELANKYAKKQETKCHSNPK